MSSFIHKYESCNLGNVLTIKCKTFFEAIYAVKNPKKIYSDPIKKWKLSSYKSDNNISGINYYKSKLECITLSNPKILEKESHKPAKKYLNRIRVQVLDESDNTVDENIKEGNKYVIFAKNKWYAVIMINKAQMKPDEMKKFEKDFEKHMTIIEKNTQKAKGTSNSYIDLISEFLQKNPKNLERIQMYEKSAQNKMDNKLKKEYLEKHADKRYKPIEKNFGTEKYKKWYMKQLNEMYNQEGGARMSRGDQVQFQSKKNQRMRERFLGVKQSRGTFMKNYISNSYPIITDVLFENFIDRIYFGQNFDKMNGIFRDIDKEIYYYANRLRTEDGEELDYSVIHSDTNVLEEDVNMLDGGKKSIQTGGNERDNLIFKIYNDFYHDFSSMRNDYNADNRDFTSFAVFNNVPHVKEDAFMRTIIEEMDPIKYRQFTFDNRDYNSERDNLVVSALQRYKQNHNDNNDLYIIEDMGIPKQIKRPNNFHLLHSKNTYTNILDPITVIDDNGNTSKTDQMIYDIFNDNNYNFNYQDRINEVITEFFQAMNHPSTWNLTSFRIPLEYLRNQSTDTEEPRFPHFKIEIYFNGAIEINPNENNANVIRFNAYGGMFSVPRINQFISFINPIGRSRSRFNPNSLTKNSDIKMWNAMNNFYTKLLTVFDNNSNRAILFIQMMKALGDHAQIKEFEIMSKEYNRGTGNKAIVFGSRDRIIVAEALRFNLPVVFEFKATDKKFPDALLRDVVEQDENKFLRDFFKTQETHKVFLYNPYDQAEEVDIGNILFKNEVINQDISLKFNMKELRLTNVDSDTGLNDIYNRILSTLNDDFLRAFNETLTSEFFEEFKSNLIAAERIRGLAVGTVSPVTINNLKKISTEKVNEYLRRILMFNRAKQIIINLIQNNEYMSSLSDKIKGYTKLSKKVADQAKGYQRMVVQQVLNNRRLTEARINNLITFGKRILSDLNKINDNIYNYLAFDFNDDEIARRMFVSDKIQRDVKYREFIRILGVYYNQNKETFNGRIMNKQIQSHREIRIIQEEVENNLLTVERQQQAMV